MYYYKPIEEANELWLSEETYDWKYLNKTESVFTTENGYMGIRASLDFKGLKSNPGMFLSGVYARTFEEEVTELVNCPDVTVSSLVVNGEILNFDSSKIIDYRRRFNLKTGELRLSALLEISDGTRLSVETKRFVSFSNKHLFCQEIRVTPVNSDVGVSCKSGINGQITNSGVSHFNSTECRVYDKRYMHYSGTAELNKVDIYEDVDYLLSEITDDNFGLERRSIYRNVSGKVKEGETLVIKKRVLVFKSEDNDYPKHEDKLSLLKETSKENYDLLFLAHEKEAEEFWKYAEIEIEGISLEDKSAVKYALLQLYGMTPKGTDRASIAAKGLSGEGYKGHVFWDTEIYMLPFFYHTMPEIAKNLLMYRYRCLEGAREKAALYGYEGAMYPWESAYDGKEETPLFAALNIHTGKANPVWSGRKEHHVSADIAFAIIKYEQITGDTEFMDNYGMEMLAEISKFWVSRAVNRNGRLEILDTIGPDEYSEHIDNNAYTNYLAKYVIENTYQKLQKLKTDKKALYESLSLKLDLPKWEDRFAGFIKDIYLPVPNDDGIIPQDDTILSNPELPDIEVFKASPIKQAVLLKYSRDEVVAMKALKQADLVMLLNLFPELFEKDIVKKNVEYYEKRTLHDSSLSYCAHAQACANVGILDMSMEFFKNALEVDLVDNPHDSTDGLHAASLGGIWNCIIQGYGGVTVTDNGVEIVPHLPDEWKKMSFVICIKGEYHKCEVTKKGAKLTPLKD